MPRDGSVVLDALEQCRIALEREVIGHVGMGVPQKFNALGPRIENHHCVGHDAMLDQPIVGTVQSPYRMAVHGLRGLEFPDAAPYPDAATAIKGEDAMKARLFKGGARVLGGEFYLAEEWLVRKCWIAGKMAAEGAEKAG